MTLDVLLIDDSRMMQEALTDLLTEIGGYRVVATVATEMDAQDWLQRHEGAWNVAILDLVLQEGSGFNVLRRSRVKPGQERIIVLSEFMSPAIAQKCLDWGAAAVFRKSEVKQLADFLTRLREPSGVAPIPVR